MTSEPTFELYGLAHLIVLTATLALAALTARASERGDVGGLAITMAGLLLLVATLKPILYVSLYEQPMAQSLPLDLCRINEFLCAFMLLARSYRVFEIAYFLAMAGSTSALLMPDLLHGFGALCRIHTHGAMVMHVDEPRRYDLVADIYHLGSIGHRHVILPSHRGNPLALHQNHRVSKILQGRDDTPRLHRYRL